MAPANERRGNWLQTVGGRAFYPLDPRPEDVDIRDIAHALSFVCRFGGHCSQFYSVAEHCVRVAVAIRAAGGSRADQFAGLMHDAAEAYLGDVVWPLKRSSELEGYRKIEKGVEWAIAERFALPLKMPPIVKRFDLVMLSTEKRDLMDNASAGSNIESAAASDSLGKWHSDSHEPLPGKLVPWSPDRAHMMFLERFEKLGGLL